MTDLHLNAYQNKLTNFSNFIKGIDSQVEGYIFSGDLCSTSFEELEKISETFRIITKKPILITTGNHDIWCLKKHLSLDEVFVSIEEILKKYNITYLDKEVFETNTSLIIGYMGWYSIFNSNNTVDYNYIPKLNSMGLSAYHFLKKKELDDMYRVIDYQTNKNKICVTHFGFPSDQQSEPYCSNKRNLEILSENCSVVIYGHSHKKETFVKNNCIFHNAGANYSDKDFNQSYIILDI